MMSHTIDIASELMMRFAERTGLTSDAPPRRYLWTDAFAVCNFLGLADETGQHRYAELALRLVDQVHHVLGTHRTDDSRTGWISGLGADEGEVHPTRAGLRIGKALAEREPSDPFDERLEWERDGQYFHYLTKWIHALDQTARFTGELRYNTWARELAAAAHEAFTYSDRGVRRMTWKMSIDLSRPLVSSMGQHDPLDGFITCRQLEATRAMLSTTYSGRVEVGASLAEATADFAVMMGGRDWTTTDPLGLGGLLADACRLAQLARFGEAFAERDLLHTLLVAALQGLSACSLSIELSQSASRRLAFRELGLAIGLSSIEVIEDAFENEAIEGAHRVELDGLTQKVREHTTLGSQVEEFWLDPAHRQSRSWSAHRDINDVMLATSLSPRGFLVLSVAE